MKTLKLVKMSTHNLPNAEHFQIHTEVKNLVQRYDPQALSLRGHAKITILTLLQRSLYMTKAKGFLLAVAAAAMAFTFSCSGDDGGGSSPSGGGSTCSANFRTVTIGTQVWAAENLNCDVSGSKCYDDDPANCAKYGRLYDWQTALTVCPSGWHLPTNDDWDKLFRYVDEQNGGEGEGTPYDSYTAGKYLKATSGWNSNGNGTDKYGFSALPGGYGCSDGSFDIVGYNGDWWSASEDVSDYAYYRLMYCSSEGAYWHIIDKSYLFSVRCLQD